MIKQTRIKWLFFILLLAAFLRLWQMGRNPPSLFRDEAEKGYTAYTLSWIGGYFYFAGFGDDAELRFQRLPLFINVFGVYTSAIYQYSAVPFVAVGGLSEWTARLPAAIVGILTVWLVYVLVGAWLRDETAALFSVGLLAISPWHIIFSRWALQGIFEPMLITVGLLFFHYGMKRRGAYLLISAIFWGLAFYTYAPARLFIPLFLICLVIIYRKPIWKEWKWSVSAGIIFLMIAVPTILYYLSAGHSVRLTRLSIFGAGEGLPGTFMIFIRNYLKHYGPDFLFIHGDRELRHSLLGMGQMYLFEAPLLIYGLWILVRERKQFRTLLLCWFLLFPIAASVTREGIPHALRSIVALPGLSIICGIAGARLWAKMKPLADIKHNKKAIWFHSLVILIVIVIVISVMTMGVNLFTLYPYYSAMNWQYGMKQALEFIHRRGVEPEKVYISGYITYAPYLVMFYDKISPTKLKKEGIGGLGYNFLPPGLSTAHLWQRIPDGSYLLLYPGELPAIEPTHIIPLPTSKRTKPEIHPALEIYVKK